MSENDVILVDAEDREIGAMEKIAAHRDGALHRAFSVYCFNGQGDVLLQRRAQGKYHAGGLWTNACDGHPRSGEGTVQAAEERLRQEMGIVSELVEVLQFTYRAELEHGMVEHEVDHVLVGCFEGLPNPDPAEVETWRWVRPEDLRDELERNPEAFAPWLRLVAEQALPYASRACEGAMPPP
ncbi:MAG: isopentenyl-diphosphate Delta-isomerase [Anaerolineae bacterium]